MTMPQRQFWHELNTWEPEQALSFYGRTLGWEFELSPAAEGGGYWIAMKDGKPVGAVSALVAPEHVGIPSHWMTYLTVPDMDQAEAEAASAGGSVLRPMLAIPGVGKLAVVMDAAGALIGLIEPEAPPLAARH